jgi:hypothetical protein
MLNRSTLTKWVTGLLGAMLALGPAISPAQALPSGDRAERCNSTLQQAEGIKFMVFAFRTHRGSDDRYLINYWLRGNGPGLRRVLAAPANRALMTRVLNLSNDIAANRNPTANIAEAEQTIQQLVENLRERREFTVEFTDASGVVASKQVAC